MANEDKSKFLTSKRFILRHELSGRIEATLESVVFGTPFRQIIGAATTASSLFAVDAAFPDSITAAAAAAEARR